MVRSSRDNFSPKIPLPVPQPTIRRDLKKQELLPKEWEGHTAEQAHQHWTLHRRDNPQKHLALKNSGDYIQETHRTLGNWVLLKGLHADSLTLGHNTKATVWKVPRQFLKETYLLILQSLLEGQGLLGTLSWTDVWLVSFLYSHSGLLGQAGTHRFCNLLLPW